jgi:hypothetical protein
MRNWLGRRRGERGRAVVTGEEGGHVDEMFSELSLGQQNQDAMKPRRRKLACQ